ncbi:rod shape-determining protein MreD [Oceaniglobus roseus]|uniref:rod shape-determining protein MreD n=1 Tax=Oceaniglobus roseus TaxID=1737570 RepID=UPI000C7EE582|nr:rod shape-determining protein MreD [Kandeliimicrobium roseum]
MVDPVARRRIAYRLLFVAIAMVVVFVQLLPFRLGDPRFPGPDILALLAFAWVLRRPSYVPVLLVALVCLFTDILFLRPIGLWSALTLAGLEFLRAREHLSRDLPFLVEWFMVSGILGLMTMGNALILAIFFVPHPPVGMAALQLVTSILGYPLVVLVSRYAFGVHKMAPGEADALGHRA